MAKRFTKLLAALALLVFMAPSMVMRADNVTILPSDGTPVTSSDFTITKNPIVVSVTASTLTSDQIRVFKNQTITISSSTATITGIEFTCTANGTTKYGPGCLTTGSGYTYEENGPHGTWTGSSNSIVFTASLNQARITQIVVTFSGGAQTVATPTFSPVGGTYTETQSVTISCETQGTTIYYTTDGSDPDDESTEYTGSITVSETTTIKAIAIDGDDNTSSVATATYTIVEPLATMDAIFAAATEAGTTATPAVVTFNNWVVTGVKNSNAYVTDGTKGFIVYNSGHGFEVGNVLSGTASCNVQLYKGAAEITGLTSTTTGLTVTTGGTVTPVTNISITDLSGVNTGAVFSYENLTYNGTNLVDGEGNAIKPYNSLYAYTLVTGHIYNVTGIFVQYDSDKEILPRSADDIEEVVAGPIIDAENVSIAADAIEGEIAYIINNPVSGGSLAAATNSEWLTLGNDFTSPIAFTCTANAETTPRTATVTLTYTYNRATVTKEVTVTQAGYEAPHVTWDLSIASYDEVTDPDLVTWSSDYVTMTNATGTGSTSASNYLGGDANNRTSSRFYTNNVWTLTPAAGYAITSVVLTATSTNYANAFVGSTWTNATATVDGTTVTVIPTNGTDAISAVIGGTCGFTSVTVYYVQDNNPSITASNVEITYDTDADEIEFVINNPVSGGSLVASTESDWLEVGDDAYTFETGIIEFTCSVNPTAAPRTATVTLTYTYNRATVTKNVTVTQAAAPVTVVYTTIPDLFAAATSTETSALVTFGDWVVSGVSTNGKNVFVTDGTNGFVIFNNGGGLDETYSVGDILAGTEVSCGLKLFNGFAELLNVNAEDLTITTGGTVTEANIAMADLTGVNTGALVSYDGLTCSVDNSGSTAKYYLSDGTTTLQVYSSLYAFEALTDGKTYNITGIYQQYNSTKEILPRSAADIEEVASTEPSITVTPVEVIAPFAGAEGTLTVTYENITEVVAEVYFCDANGDAANYDWIVAEINAENNVEYLIEENEGEARTAYLKVWAYDDDLNEVYSNLVTINQAQYVVDYATLPFEFDGGKADIETTNGLTQEGLDSDYGSSPKLKFNTTGDWLLLHFNERPGILTFDIKGNTFSGGVFTVQTSEDGVTYTDLATYTSFGSSVESEEFNNLGENVRYIKWIYTSKDQGNVALGNITLDAYEAPVPAITVESTTITVPAEETQGTLNVTYTAIETTLGASIYWYTDNTGTTATDEPNWISAGVNETTLNVDYLIADNNGEARTAYFKVYALDGELNDVYSDLVTVNQDAYVAPAEPGNWVLTSLADLTADDIFVIVGDNGDTYAMTNDNGTSAPAAVAVTVVDGTLSGEPADNLKWNLEITEDGYVFYPNGDTENWLYCTNTNNGVKVGTGDAKHFTLDDEFEGYLTITETTDQRYIGIYNSQDWRCY